MVWECMVYSPRSDREHHRLGRLWFWYSLSLFHRLPGRGRPDNSTYDSPDGRADYLQHSKSCLHRSLIRSSGLCRHHGWQPAYRHYWFHSQRVVNDPTRGLQRGRWRAPIRNPLAERDGRWKRERNTRRNVHGRRGCLRLVHVWLWHQCRSQWLHRYCCLYKRS